MDNIEFNTSFLRACEVFQPYRISDHSSAVLRLPMNSEKKPCPFKFYNLLVHNSRFKEVVANGWQISVSGFLMFKVVKRLKLLKKPLRKLLYDQGNLHSNVKQLWHELDEAQKALDSDPSNLELREKEAAYLKAYHDALIMEERMLVQKAKVDWLKLGDANTAYFHKVGNLASHPSFIQMAFLSNQLSSLAIDSMIRKVTNKEIQDAMLSLGDNKASGPDRYTAAFFKEAWDTILVDVCKAIKEFFTNGVLLKELNHTIISLIPKVVTPLRINDFWPISCCNVLFKCISKIISNRMKESLSELVSLNQSAFVPERRILDNILLTQELMHNYYLDRGPARCAFKVDIQKAYNTVDWNFLHETLIGFGFHPRMIGWIMECVTSTSFSISINGCLHGYFKGKRGLRQGDPMSPYLFTLIMEVLTLMLNRRVQDSNSFTFHRYCSKLNIVNLCFADDLFLFAHGDVDSARVIMDSLEEFKNALSLVPSLPKSTAYFCNVLNYVKLGILNILPFEEGKLLVKYLGVPLVPSRLVHRDCVELMEKLEQVMRGFLWCQGEMKKGKAKALIASHIWSLLSGLAEDLASPPIVEAFFWNRLGNGNLTSAWFDTWSSIGPLSNIVSNRDINTSGFRLDSKVSDIIHYGAWTWPNDWLVKYPSLVNVAVPLLSEATDSLSLRHLNKDMGFSVAAIWECIRPRFNEIDYFALQVWENLKRFTCIDNLPSDLNSIVDFFIPLAKMRSIRSVICKLVFVASCYFIWKEHNFRLFKKVKRTQDHELIKSNVRLKLLLCSFKKTLNVKMLCHLWKLPDSLMRSPRHS
ncbi:hypothetical protein Tco_1036795 [Tanacetum coccineum]